jgi:acetyl-CoA hydrolase
MPPPIDLTSFIRPDDTILWGQGSGEPQTLVEALVEQRAELGGVTAFIGATFSDTLQPEHADHLRFVGIGGIGGNARLTRAGVLDVLPCHISATPRLIHSGRIPCDVVFLHLSPAGEDGRHSLGLIGDYLRAAIDRARVVVAEINDQVPYTFGDGLVDPSEIDHFIHTSRPPVEIAAPAPGPTEQRIGELVAELIPDGAVLQLGIGSVPRAIAAGLSKKKDLGVHSGLIGDWVVDLMEAGAVTNARKPVDPGITITGAIFGTRRLYDFVDRNPAIGMRAISHTHDITQLRRLGALFAINSAVEIDLTGQVNAETLGGTHIGAVGGQVDFVRAALASDGGRSIIALQATAKRGEISRIVPRLRDGVVTTPRSDVDVIVTEHGVADLRGTPLRERARRLIEIADPRFRDDLTAHLPSLC